ncbi:hypothetical protein XENOCAPTIV_013828 [Xenoophorus captivus]|uniref:PilZ domain-containing protein n=1 Tax=Xenoophorus captivus TaxID=1517983 RepID=A0ABV0QJE2_9TELE
MNCEQDFADGGLGVTLTLRLLMHGKEVGSIIGKSIDRKPLVEIELQRRWSLVGTFSFYQDRCVGGVLFQLPQPPKFEP